MDKFLEIVALSKHDFFFGIYKCTFNKNEIIDSKNKQKLEYWKN